MSINLGDLNIRVLLEIISAEKNAKNFTAELKNISTESDRVKSSTISLSDKIQGAGLRVDGFRAILDVLRSTFGSLISEYNRQEIALSKLANGLKNVGEGSEALKELSDQASNLQQITPFADEEISNAQAMLTTFQKNSEEIKILTPRILDLAAAYQKSGESGMDLQQVAVLLGKVNEETIGGLRRVGVAFSKEQEEKLKSLQGTEQAIYLSGILDSNFKGMAETVGNTAAGQMKIFDNKLSDVRESLGKILSEALTPLLKPLGDFLITIANADEPTKLLTISVIGLASAFVVLNTSMGGIPYIIGGIITVLGNVYIKYKETGSIVRATEADFSSFGSTIMSVMTFALTPIYQIRAAILLVQRAIDDTIYRWNALKTGEYLNALEPGIHELPDPYEKSDSQMARDQTKAYGLVKSDEPKIDSKDIKPPLPKTSNSKVRENIEKVIDLSRFLDISVDKLEQIANSVRQSGINRALPEKRRGLNSAEPSSGPAKLDLQGLFETVSNVKAEEPFSDKLEKGLTTSLSLAHQLSNVLGIGADTFAGKLLSGLQQGFELANSIASIILMFSSGGSGGIFKLLGLASGGYVPGSGSGDSVPAMLTPGEFVINKARASKLGSNVLNWLNGGGSVINPSLNHSTMAANQLITIRVIPEQSVIKSGNIHQSWRYADKIINRRKA